ncbi:gluconate 2-dehydrogenase subunit 3 family protein [Gluconacetobacter asukensis]|uniref:Gluconate 2-dehydrogenase subunit 3 family protein n=1 Tax=Gluconacetobacter asukensis TaxID=1017181 RepID=A0A7W4J2P4_9PROT|nr:gluconate 2-dehydrogenase subunit 3 family protein [Gluconacetobacter asukensis]MBB2173605.1 gluconate 2-dehydrogenase subunit 3 family protein [Gluconacetobacter asukensis]
MKRRDVIKGGLVLMATTTLASIYKPAYSKTFVGGSGLWKADPPPPLTVVDSSRLVYLTQAEAKLVGAVFDILIPPDELGIGATEAGCVTFLDHQLAGPYGAAAKDYRLGPVVEGLPQQGPQSIATPAELYRKGLVELDHAAQAKFGKPFIDLAEDQKIDFMKGIETGTIAFETLKSNEFFSMLLQNVREGYLADPMYGGNRGMVGWKLVGFPGAIYDYRDWMVSKRGQKIDVEPVSLLSRA